MATKIWGVGGTLFIQIDTAPKPETVEYSTFDGIGSDTVRITDQVDKIRRFDILIADVVTKAGAAPPAGNAMIDILEYIATERKVT